MKNIKEFMDFLQKRANQKREDAGYSGSWGDGGASNLEHSMEVYKAGIDGISPPSWNELWKEFNYINNDFRRQCSEG